MQHLLGGMSNGAFYELKKKVRDHLSGSIDANFPAHGIFKD